MSDKIKLVKPEHIGDGLYMEDEGYYVAIAVNNHNNKVAYLEVTDIDKAINYLTKVKNRIKNGN